MFPTVDAIPIKTPKIVYLTTKGVLIECPHVPIQSKGVTDEHAAEKTRQTHCSRCGYLRDARINNMAIACFNPSSPYLAQVKTQLKPSRPK